MSKYFNGDFLHNLPKALDTKQLIAFEAISISIDIILLKYDLVRYRLSKYQSFDAIKAITQAERILIFSDLWSIIDNAHSIMQQLFKADKKTKNEEKKEFDFIVDLVGTNTNKTIRSFYDNYSETLATLRNKMDHISSNLEKLAEKRAVQEPLFGTLTYFLKTTDHSLNEFDCVQITCSSFVRDSHSFMGLNPSDLKRKFIYHPIDHLQLSAFNSDNISITDLYDDCKAVREIINTDLANHFEKELKEFSKKNNLEEKDVFAENPGHATFLQRFKMATKEEIQEYTNQGIIDSNKTEN